jgi:hypothetical protein
MSGQKLATIGSWIGIRTARQSHFKRSRTGHGRDVFGGVTPKVVLNTHAWFWGRHGKHLVGGVGFWIDNGVSPHATV